MAFAPRRPKAATPSSGLLVRFWGVRGSVAVPGPTTVWYGGNTACVEVRYGRDIVVLDAGTGIRELGKDLAREFTRHSGRVWILITHTHWDHIQGFPFFAPAYQSGHRIRILGWRGSREGLQRTIAAAVESPFFPVTLREMPGSISVDELDDFEFRVGDLKGQAAMLNHPGGGVGFRLSCPDGSIAYVPDHEIPCLEPDEHRKSDATGPADDAAERVKAIHRLTQDVDVLIHDAQYTVEEYATRVGWGHSCVDAVVKSASQNGVRRLVLFHHDPDRDDGQVDAMLASARHQGSQQNPGMEIDAAREGLEIRLKRKRFLATS